MVDSFEIADHKVKPGRVLRTGLPVARLFTQQMIDIPLIVVHGGAPGPVVWLSAAIHGDEIHGTEIIRRVIEAIDPKSLRGTILAVPVVNAMGFVQQSRYLPDRRDLNRSFPGALRGSLGSRLARIFMTQIVERAQYGIDLHAGSDHRTNFPQIRGDLTDPRVVKIAKAFAPPYIVNAPLRAGSLRGAAKAAGVPCLLYEASEAHRMEEGPIAMGTAGCLRVLGRLKMIDDYPARPKRKTVTCGASRWVRAPHAGIAHLTVEAGELVTEGQVIGVVRDIYGDVMAKIRTRHAGALIGQSLSPLVNRGDAIVNIADVVN